MENYAAPVENPWNLPVADAQDLHADAVKFAEKEESEDAAEDADDGDGDDKTEDEGDGDKAADGEDGDGDNADGEDEGKSDVQMLVRMLLEICRCCRN